MADFWCRVEFEDTDLRGPRTGFVLNGLAVCRADESVSAGLVSAQAMECSPAAVMPMPMTRAANRLR